MSASRPSSVERRVGRPLKAEHYRAIVEQLIADAPEMLTRDLLVRAKLAGYDGGKTAFYTLVARVRSQAAPRALGGVPGAISHHDSGEADVTFVSGDRRRVRFVASRLAYSSFLEVSLVESDTDEAVARALADHFVAMGGVPLLARFERPRPVPGAWPDSKDVPPWSIGFACFAADLGIGIEVAAPRGRGKAGLARAVKDALFGMPSFADRADVARRLAAFCDESNHAVGRLVDDERQRLRPVPARARDLFFRIPIVVGPGGVVAHGTHVYSMPAAAAWTMGTLFLGREHVRIEAGPFTATHPRL